MITNKASCTILTVLAIFKLIDLAVCIFYETLRVIFFLIQKMTFSNTGTGLNQSCFPTDVSKGDGQLYMLYSPYRHLHNGSELYKNLGLIL